MLNLDFLLFANEFAVPRPTRAFASLNEGQDNICNSRGSRIVSVKHCKRGLRHIHVFDRYRCLLTHISITRMLNRDARTASEGDHRKMPMNPSPTIGANIMIAMRTKITYKMVAKNFAIILYAAFYERRPRRPTAFGTAYNLIRACCFPTSRRISFIARPHASARE